MVVHLAVQISGKNKNSYVGWCKTIKCVITEVLAFFAEFVFSPNLNMVVSAIESLVEGCGIRLPPNIRTSVSPGPMLVAVIE